MDQLNKELLELQRKFTELYAKMEAGLIGIGAHLHVEPRKFTEFAEGREVTISRQEEGNKGKIILRVEVDGVEVITLL